MQKILAMLFLSFPLFVHAGSVFDGNWSTQDGSKLIPIAEFDGSVTLSTSTYYNNGALVTWFFEFKLPPGGDAKVGEVINGRVRSIDGYYSCVFDEKAKLQLQSDGALKIHFPLLTYHRETRSVRDPRQGHYQERYVSWDGWGWVETRYSFPIDHYRVISSECIVDQRNWVTNILTKTNAPFPPLMPEPLSK
ncbi:hypothetical protein [Bdellovibrio sp. HCB337]|uniref:hypothetical protein n=1 Tax=Bdellovibrio sp. HCB337 TaxID=3394358 RepID=UPI0039A50ABF